MARNKISALLTIVFAVLFNLGFSGINLGPWLMPTQDMGKTMAIAWQTQNATGGTVHYGINSTNENQVAASTTDKKKRVILQGLVPGVRYQYKVVSDG